MSDLKPVPCGCGGRPIIEYGEDGICRVRCSFCLTGTVYHRNKAEAIEAWNRAMSGAKDINVPDKERTAKVKQHFMLVTGGMGGTISYCDCGCFVTKDQNYCPSCGTRLEWE